MHIFAQDVVAQAKRTPAPDAALRGVAVSAAALQGVAVRAKHAFVPAAASQDTVTRAVAVQVACANLALAGVVGVAPEAGRARGAVAIAMLLSIVMLLLKVFLQALLLEVLLSHLFLSETLLLVPLLSKLQVDRRYTCRLGLDLK